MDRHAFVTAHWDNLTFQVSCLRRETTLVNGELTQAIRAGIGISLRNNPSRRITDTKIEDLPLGDQCVEGLHQFRDIGRKVPAMNVILFRVGLCHDHRDGDCALTKST